MVTKRKTISLQGRPAKNGHAEPMGRSGGRPPKFKAVLRELDSIREASIHAQYTVARGIHFLIGDNEFHESLGMDFDQINAQIDKYVDLFPGGMTRTFLAEMFNQFPAFEEWKSKGAKAIYDLTLVEIGKRKTFARRSNTTVVDASSPIAEKPIPQQTYSAKLAETIMEKDRAQQAAIESDQKRRDTQARLDAALQRIGELELENNQLRKELRMLRFNDPVAA